MNDLSHICRQYNFKNKIGCIINRIWMKFVEIGCILGADLKLCHRYLLFSFDIDEFGCKLSKLVAYC